MPEIKHNFTKGRMNKDLDERLVPNGEYRDAMNIQVSTSEGSDVGTIQNILGNSIVPEQEFLNSLSLVCVGSVSDEKNDKLYWMLAGTTWYNIEFSIGDLLDVDPNDRVRVDRKDMILEYDNSDIAAITNNVVTPVVIDIYSISIPQSTGFSASQISMSSPVLNNLINPSGITKGMTLEGYDINGSIIYSAIVIDISGTDIVLSENITNFFNIEWFVFTKDRVLNFNALNTITGVNIIDDFLLWTDNNSEPKKINIQRSIDGTQYTTTSTRLIVPENNITLSDDVLLEESHITVIRKSPKTQLAIDLETSRKENLTYTGRMTISTASMPGLNTFTGFSSVIGTYDFSNLHAKDQFEVIIDEDIDGNTIFELEWGVNKKVVLEEYDVYGNSPPVPISGYTIKGTIISGVFISTPTQDASVVIEITSIDGTPPTPIGNNNSLHYAIDLFDETEKLFEFKFPRFSYRYKYEDGEYSTFAPWSQVVFIPGSFDYHPKKGYNIGMTNRLESITIKNFITPNIPTDVVAIDILYKEEVSTSIYIVDTIKPLDNTVQNQNAWENNEYKITSETVKNILPSNQLLRPWDNVPRKALAQEITGNRLVYGNYLQNFNLPTEDPKLPTSPIYNPEFGWKIQTIEDFKTPLKSIKSLREYQIGILFTDEYGRETPIMSNPTGAFKLEKGASNRANSLNVELIDEKYPVNMDYFKFYIKETSGEYYNMAMDRWYDAEDGNIWLSFPSSDRNKIDIDTFLILKKGVESNELIIDPARYKVIAIENEAPDFIKIKKTVISDQIHNSGTTNVFDPSPIPTETSSKFKIAYTGIYDVSGIWNLASEYYNFGTLYFELSSLDGTLRSSRYRISTIALVDNDNNWLFQMDEPFDSGINIFTDDPSGAGSSIILDDTRVIFYSDTVENKPEFDGRFFVKIYNDDVFTKNIINNNPYSSISYNTIAAKKIYSFSEGNHNLAWKNPPQSASNIPDYSITRYGNAYRTWANYITATTRVASVTSDIATFNSEDYAMWKPHVAFFRGTNIYRGDTDSYHLDGPHAWDQRTDNLDLHDSDASNWAFEDVWFVDNNRSQGSFTLDLSFSSGGWNDSPNTQNVYGVGINNTGPGAIIELGFGGIQPKEKVNWPWDINSPIFDPSMFDIGDGNLIYESQQDFISKLKQGAMVKWKEDPTGTVYKIVNIYNFLRVRYDDNPSFDDQYSFARGLDATGNDEHYEGGSDYKCSTYFRPSNYTRNWKIELDKPLVWDPSAVNIPNGLKITVVAAIAYTNPHMIEVNSLTGTDPMYGPQRLQVGMVLAEVDGSVLSTQDWAIISEIDNTNNTLMLKRYDLAGATNVSFSIGSISANDNLLFYQVNFNGLSPNSAKNINYFNGGRGFSTNKGTDAIGYTFEILEPSIRETKLPTNPAIWETEPKDTNVDLDIYYEASNSIPLVLNSSNINIVLPIGSIITSPINSIFPNTTINDNNIYYNNVIADDIIELSQFACEAPQGCANPNGIVVPGLQQGDSLIIERSDKSNITVTINEVLSPSAVGTRIRIEKELYKTSSTTLNWFNCYSFGNGVESNRIRDNFNLPYILNGVKVSTILEEGGYKEERRKYGLIYSGLYNSISGVNNLNQFIAAEKITKDINPIYGSIQKLHTRDTDLVTLCEDKILRILANKDAVYEADGNSQLTATNRVLGQTTPFVGEFGISKNPESFASESYRVYFTDKVRGAVMRLSKDGLTPISMHGMKDWFRDNLKLSNKLVGSYDDRNDEYNITLDHATTTTITSCGTTTTTAPTTVSFREDVTGWVSFKSFIPENAISCANDYFTIKNGKLYKHYDKSEDRNTFYGNYTDSSVNVILNNHPGSVKSFHTLDYEGSQSKIDQFQIDPITRISDAQPYNLGGKLGWYVESVITDLESGSLNEFIEKEGKWFNYFHGKSITTSPSNFVECNYDTDSFAIQGIGYPESTNLIGILGCTDPTATNYNPSAVNDDGSCFWEGCMDSSATNYNPLATVDDGSCIIPGCMDSSATNYNPNATIDDGSCIMTIYGCMDSNASNYNSLATVDDGSCTYPVTCCNTSFSPHLTIDGYTTLELTFVPTTCPGFGTNALMTVVAQTTIILPNGTFYTDPITNITYNPYNIAAYGWTNTPNITSIIINPGLISTNPGTWTAIVTHHIQGMGNVHSSCGGTFTADYVPL